MDGELVQQERIAYFTMEIALRNEIPTYAGGLGILAGDTLRSAADLELPLVGVSLVSRAGYFRQEIGADGRQIDHPDSWEPSRWAQPLEAKVSLRIEGREVWVGGWVYVLAGHTGGRRPVILLDTDLDGNDPGDRSITDRLYGGDAAYRLKQEMVLGIGGVRMLNALGFGIRQFHMNEGHSALLTLELLRRSAYPSDELHSGEPRYDVPQVRGMCSFTTHTPVEAGHDQFPWELVRQVVGDLIDEPALRALAGPERMNLTRLALNLSEYVNGVAKRHAETSRRMFPGYRVHSITNGVHPFTWTSAPFRALYDELLPAWRHEPEMLVRADCCIADERIRAAHTQAREALILRVHERSGATLDPEQPILGFARRMTAYKRPDLLFSDPARLRDIAARCPFQVVLAGKAHPRDEPGKELIARLHAQIRELDGAVRCVYLPDYDMGLALEMVAGVDVWLNTPLPPMEASGTSGMKAAFNGVPSLSVLDGWWLEGCIEGVTGWAVGDGGGTPDSDAEALYRKLDEVVLPLYHGDPAGWTAVMKGAIAKTASIFNSHRMMRRYASDAYIR